MDYLSEILKRKRTEVRRRYRYQSALRHWVDQTRNADQAGTHATRGANAVNMLRRRGAIGVIAEVKFKSPSAGPIRVRAAGEGVRIAQSYERAGAKAVSVLADRAGFDGSLLEVRRVARAIDAPVLLKEFVLDPIQVEWAYVSGASLVLLLVRALSDDELRSLIAAARTFGLEPVVEAANREELERALATEATVVGVNARDLRTFGVDRAAATRAIETVPEDRVAVFMSGIRTKNDLAAVAGSRADAALIGEGLMRAADPETQLRDVLSLAGGEPSTGS